MKIAVIGVGYVGLVSGSCLADAGNHVIGVDNDARKIKDLKRGIIPIYEPGLTEIVMRNEAAKRLEFTNDLSNAVKRSDLIILAVGTPSADDGSADLSMLLAAAEEVAGCMDGYKIIVTKSTVPVGTYKKVIGIMKSKTDEPFDYVSNPEFLKEGAAVEDFLKPDRVIIGAQSQKARETMRLLYSAFMRKGSRVLFMDPASAEMSKYASNVMLATRISFMNELSRLCEIVGADIEQVRLGLGSDPRIGNSFLFPGVGYGGSCFPKDVSALIHIGDDNKFPMTIASAVKKVNYEQRQYFADRIINYFKDFKEPVTLSTWGLAFKAKTDDIRESPALYCIKRFLDAGMKVKAFDPQAMDNAKRELPANVEYVENEYDALNGADALVIFTDWQEFRNPDFILIKDKLKKPLIFDGRNLYEPGYLKERGIEYHCIGRL